MTDDRKVCQFFNNMMQMNVSINMSEHRFVEMLKIVDTLMMKRGASIVTASGSWIFAGRRQTKGRRQTGL